MPLAGHDIVLGHYLGPFCPFFFRRPQRRRELVPLRNVTHVLLPKHDTGRKTDK